MLETDLSITAEIKLYYDVFVPENLTSPSPLLIAVHGYGAHKRYMDEHQASIVEMRFFGGMSNSEIAESLGVSERTVGREWNAARLWLYRELNGAH